MTGNEQAVRRGARPVAAIRRATAALVLVLLAGCEVPHPSIGIPPATASTGGTPARTTPAVAVDQARKQLAELRVAARGTLAGYSRQRFPHWATVSGTCNVREDVLKRDGENVKVNADCEAVSGTWHSAYDGGTWTKASDVDIDHMVPLAQSWVSGASSWTDDQRRAFANDRARPQLFAVTDNVNQEKSDKAPDQWKPPLVSFWCTYATDWIVVKHHYGLTITRAEQQALATMLDRCSDPVSP